ncbi:MAG: type II toxin-antitoxin system HicB family antitoxin [Acidimicrobiia bacterium]
MTRTKNYVAVYERDPESDAWLVSIKGIDGCHTYGRSLRQAEDRIREALALWLDRDPDGLTITPQWPPELASVASEATQARSAASDAARRATTTMAKAAQRLDHMGLSRRDAADILGISHQRVQQLLVSRRS